MFENAKKRIAVLCSLLFFGTIIDATTGSSDDLLSGNSEICEVAEEENKIQNKNTRESKLWWVIEPLAKGVIFVSEHVWLVPAICVGGYFFSYVNALKNKNKIKNDLMRSLDAVGDITDTHKQLFKDIAICFMENDRSREKPLETVENIMRTKGFEKFEYEEGIKGKEWEIFKLVNKVFYYKNEKLGLYVRVICHHRGLIYIRCLELENLRGGIKHLRLDKESTFMTLFLDAVMNLDVILLARKGSDDALHEIWRSPGLSEFSKYYKRR